MANEIEDEARKKKQELILFKVDFEKAYDYVLWDYMDMVMKAMRFPGRWKRWIRACLRSAAASILVNGSRIDEFVL